MLQPKALRAALAKSPPSWFVAYDGLLYRAISERDFQRATESNPENDNRFNLGRRSIGEKAFGVLYASTDELTPSFEVRHRIYTGLGIVSVPSVVSHIAVIHASLRRLLDLRDPEIRRALRTNSQEITGNWREHSDHDAGVPTQWLGHALHDMTGAVGIIYRSKYDTGDNVFVLLDRLNEDESLALREIKAL